MVAINKLGATVRTALVVSAPEADDNVRIRPEIFCRGLGVLAPPRARVKNAASKRRESVISSKFNLTSDQVQVTKTFLIHAPRSRSMSAAQLLNPKAESRVGEPCR